jgi:predicted lipid-binding transport protein (Tim44 family)
MKLVESIAETLGFGPTPGSGEQFLAALVAAVLIANRLLLLGVTAGLWAKRKIASSFRRESRAESNPPLQPTDHRRRHDPVPLKEGSHRHV